MVRAERERAEALLNDARAAIVLLFAIAAAIYAPSISSDLRRANLAVLAPMLVWTLTQLYWHRVLRNVPAWVAIVNPIVDTTAVTVILLAYGLAASPAVALKAPLFLAYLVIIAARPITGSTRQAAMTVGLAVVEYTLLVAYLVFSGPAPVIASPVVAAEMGYISLLDEGARIVFLAVIGGLAIWATSWHERLLRRALAAQVTRADEERDLVLRLQEADKLAALGTLAASLAHEVNNPLATIAMTAQLLESEVVGQARADAQMIAEQARHTSRIVRELLGFARMRDTAIGSVSVGMVIERALGMLRPMVRDNRISIERAIGDTPTIVGDASRLERVVLNLLINAVQALEGWNGQKMVRASCGTDAGAVWIAIEDSGPGFTPEIGNRLFERFFTTKPSGKGTGLGLWIVHQIVEEHGGTIEALNRPEGGARFLIHLPLGEGRSPGAEQSAAVIGLRRAG
jgi:signal transduction histidine kinase